MPGQSGSDAERNRPENAVYGFSDDETHPRLIRKDRSRQRRASSWSRA